MGKKYIQFKNAVMRLYSSVAAVAVIVLVVSSFVQVVGRYIFNASPSWSEELARYAFIWSSALGAACALDCGGHAVITVLSDHMDIKRRTVLKLVITLIIIVLSVVLCKEGWNLTAATLSMLSPALRIPMACINVSVVFCGIGLIVSSIATLMEIPAEMKSETKEG